LQVSDYKF